MGPDLRQTLKRQFSNVLDLPPEVLLDYATITLIGDVEAKIVNHKGLVQYTTTSIKARSLQGMIEVVGKGLEIVSFSASEMKISGQIRQVMLK
jgi:sporulation protein YqfC